MDKVSVIIPVFNGGECLRRSLSQIKTQSYPNLEIIVIDDGSEDDTLMRIKECSDDRFVIIEKKKNEGVSAARNAGLDAAKGKYVVFPDADDLVRRDYVLRLLELIKEKNAQVAVCSYSRFGSDGVIKEYGDLSGLAGAELSGYHFALGCIKPDGLTSNLWNKIYIKDLTDGMVFDENTAVGEDLLFNLEYAKRVKTAAITDECLYGYYVNPLGALRKMENSGLVRKRLTEWDALKKAAGMLKAFPEYEKADGARMFYKLLIAAHTLYYPLKDMENKGEYENRTMREMEKVLFGSKRKISANPYINSKWKAKLLAGIR